MDNGWNLARGESSSCRSLIFKVEESNYNHSKKLQPGNKEREEPILSLSLLSLPPPFPPFSLVISQILCHCPSWPKQN